MTIWDRLDKVLPEAPEDLPIVFGARVQIRDNDSLWTPYAGMFGRVVCVDPAFAVVELEGVTLIEEVPHRVVFFKSCVKVVRS